MNAMRYLCRLLLAVLVFPVLCHANGANASDAPARYANGCRLYSEGEYRAAVGEFKAAAAGVESSDIYYNLGNCYFRLNDYPHARWAYERAVRVSPSNADAKYNLRLTIAKLKSAGVQPQSFISSGFNTFVYSHGVAGWAVWALALFTIALVCVLAFLFAGRIWMRKGAFALAAVSILLMIVAFVAAGVQTYKAGRPSEAIVLQGGEVKQSPSANSRAVTRVTPGEKVNLTSNASDGVGVGGWREVALGGGQKGWIPSSSIGII